jgi:hypothetical protein
MNAMAAIVPFDNRHACRAGSCEGSDVGRHNIGVFPADQSARSAPRIPAKNMPMLQ